MSFDWEGTTVGDSSTARFDVPAFIMASGYHVKIPVHVVTGNRAGPVVLVSTASHGDETWCVEYSRRLYINLTSGGHDFAGTILLVPVLNPIAVDAGTRNTPVDLHNLNRVFPGGLPGRSWFSDALAKVIADRIVVKTDVIVDCHSGDGNTANHYHHTANPNESAFHARVHEIALASGAEVIWEQPEQVGMLSHYAQSLGKTYIVPQYGGGTMLTDAHFQIAWRNLLNMLRVIEVVKGTPKRGATRIVVRQGGMVRPAHGGTFIPCFGIEMLGKTVAGGTILGRVHSPYDFSVLHELSAPYEHTEILQVRDRISKVQPGDYAFVVADRASGYAA